MKQFQAPLALQNARQYSPAVIPTQASKRLILLAKNHFRAPDPHGYWACALKSKHFRVLLRLRHGANGKLL